MNTNFKVRRVTGYDPGYPVGRRRRAGRLEARPLKFLFLVVGFLFFFVGFGCGEKEERLSGVPEYDGDSLTTENETPDYDDLQGVTDPDFPLDDETPDYYDNQPAGVDETVPMYDDEYVPDVDYDDQLAGEMMPDTDELAGDELLSDDDSVICPIDEELAGIVAPDTELPDDEPLAGDPVPVMRIKK